MSTLASSVVRATLTAFSTLTPHLLASASSSPSSSSSTLSLGSTVVGGRPGNSAPTLGGTATTLGLDIFSQIQQTQREASAAEAAAAAAAAVAAASVNGTWTDDSAATAVSVSDLEEHFNRGDLH